jgi:hypothetical protein
MASQCGAGGALEGLSLLRSTVAHTTAARGSGYSLLETAVKARLANWADVPDVALLRAGPPA